MTTYTLAAARDAVTDHFENEWVNGLSFLASKIYYQNRRNDKPDDSNSVWCRYSFINTNSNKSSLTNEAGSTLFDRHAMVLIELMMPIGDGIDDVTPQSILDIYEGGVPSISGIWFREVSVREIGVIDNWFQTNITAEVVYTQVK